MFAAGAHSRVPSMLAVSELVSPSMLATDAVDAGVGVTAECCEELVEKG